MAENRRLPRRADQVLLIVLLASMLFATAGCSNRTGDPSTRDHVVDTLSASVEQMDQKAKEDCRRLVPVDSEDSSLVGAMDSTQREVAELVSGFDPSNADPNVESLTQGDGFAAICIVTGETITAGIPSGARYLAIYQTSIAGGDASGEVAFW